MFFFLIYEKNGTRGKAKGNLMKGVKDNDAIDMNGSAILHLKDDSADNMINTTANGDDAAVAAGAAARAGSVGDDEKPADFFAPYTAPGLMELDEAQVDQEILEQYEKKNKENIALLGGKSVNEGESSVNAKNVNVNEEMEANAKPSVEKEANEPTDI